MCVISASPSKSQRPTLETLQACEAQNPHGAGVAFIENGKPFFQKGLKAAQIFKLAKNVKGPMVVHFRWATVGGINDNLCHPFIVSKTSPLAREGYAKALLFHNGTWTSREHQLKAEGLPTSLKGLTSDSRLAATMVDAAGVGALAEMEGRYCILTKHGFKLHNNGWTKWRGVWFSNMRWHQPRPVVGLYQPPKKRLAVVRRPAKQKPAGAKRGARKRGPATANEVLGRIEGDLFTSIDSQVRTRRGNVWPD